MTARDPVEFSDRNAKRVGNEVKLTDASGNIFINAALNIALGDIEGYSVVHKFGDLPDVDLADGFVDVWDYPTEKIYTFSSSADIDSISSDNGADIEEIEIQGLDGAYGEVVQTITLNGQTRVALTTPLLRVFRANNMGNSDLVGNAYIYPNTAITGGIPDDTTKVRAYISSGNNQTLMAIYTVPAKKTALLASYYATTLNKAAAANIVQLWRRERGGVFQIKETIAVNTQGAGYIRRPYEVPVLVNSQTDMLIKANSTDNNIHVSAGFDLILVDN